MRRKVAAVALVTGLLAACIIADPLPEQRSLPTRVPSIILTTPDVSRPLLEAPDGGFNVTLRLYNPAAGYRWRVFVDYDDGVNPNPVPGLNISEPGSSDLPDVQTVTFSLSRAAMDPERCHVIEFVVALVFGAFPHNGDPGADSVSWRYVPGGDYSKCAQYDASVPDARPLDAGMDGSDASP
ncbi:hypothetical protein LVJ94_22615 [Pendulispora rubella]|uniref:Proteinase inhibitor I42 chagasin domain-containing protein n=1 Tax=Pendulispora rubella TaxID=2741070 RepID=A0ABZ2LGF0_9BACT